MRKTSKIWEIYPNLAQAVKDSHIKFGMEATHHDHLHAFGVGQVAMEVAMPHDHGKNYSRLAGAAGLCHSADRILQVALCKSVDYKVGQKGIENMVRYWLGKEDSFLDEEREWIVEAVLLHGEPHKHEHNIIITALIDADRLVNSGADNVVRLAKYLLDTPIVDTELLLSDPEANFRNPKSILRSLYEQLEWLDPESEYGVKLPESKRRAEKLLSRRQDFIIWLVEDLESRRLVTPDKVDDLLIKCDKLH